VILSTTESIDGRKVVSYLGIVSAEVIMGGNIFKDFFASVRDVVGGRAGAYEKVFGDAKAEALADLAEKGRRLSADAIVGIDLDYEVIGGDQRTLLMVSANGTAVKLG